VYCDRMCLFGVSYLGRERSSAAWVGARGTKANALQLRMGICVFLRIYRMLTTHLTTLRSSKRSRRSEADLLAASSSSSSS
jgi:hypothetical protein